MATNRRVGYFQKDSGRRKDRAKESDLTYISLLTTSDPRPTHTCFTENSLLRLSGKMAHFLGSNDAITQH